MMAFLVVAAFAAVFLLWQGDLPVAVHVGAASLSVVLFAAFLLFRLPLISTIINQYVSVLVCYCTVRTAFIREDTRMKKGKNNVCISSQSLKTEIVVEIKSSRKKED